MKEKQNSLTESNESNSENLPCRLTLEERADLFGGRLGPYEEFDWGDPVGREIW